MTYVEAARALATDLLKGDEQLPNRRLAELAFRRVLIRPPQPDELQILSDSLSRLQLRYAARVDQARELISVGESPTDATLDPIRLAALTALCNLILNLDEALCRE